MPQIKKEKVVYPELSYKILGLCFSIHNELGRYCNEQQYSDAFEANLKKENINHVREKFLPPLFEGEKNRNKPDFLIDAKIIVDFKAKRIIGKDDYFQMRRYLNATNLRLGIIVNFRPKFISHKRVLNSDLPH